jgi:hypothetical protein
VGTEVSGDSIGGQAAREYASTLCPHHVGSPYDKDNAEWLLAQLKSFGLDAKIEQFEALFPTPKSRKLELLGPTRFEAKLEEPTLTVDPTSGQKDEQCPPTTPIRGMEM